MDDSEYQRRLVTLPALETLLHAVPLDERLSWVHTLLAIRLLAETSAC